MCENAELHKFHITYQLQNSLTDGDNNAFLCLMNIAYFKNFKKEFVMSLKTCIL